MLEAARETELTRRGIAELADRLRAGARDPGELVEGALDAGEVRAALALALAAGAAGRPIDAGLIGPIFTFAESPEFFAALVGCCAGDRIGVMLDVVDAERVSHERAALALFLATLLVDGDPPPRLSALVRTLARASLHYEAGALLGAAAGRLGDPDVRAVAARWIELARQDSAIPEHIESQFRGEVLESLPDSAPPKAAVGFTVRRAAAKVRRNQPCPCGSGKKYKRCCAGRDQERLADPSPVAGLTMAEYRAEAHKHMDPAELNALRPAELARLDFEELSSVHLIITLRKLAQYRFWGDAERAMAVLAARDDLPGGAHPDAYRDELIHEAFSAGEHSIARRHIEALRDERSVADARLRKHLLDPGPETLAVLDEHAREALGDPEKPDLVELAFALLDAFPALGIAVARGAISAERSLDSELLLEEIERCRDRLGLSPGDPAESHFEHLVGAELDRRIKAAISAETSEALERALRETEALREQLREANAGAGRMRRRLVDQEERLAAAEINAARPSAPTVDSGEIKRLRGKVRELKGLVGEGNEERRRLRARLSEMTQRISASEPPTKSVKAEISRPESAPTFTRPLVPVFSTEARDAIEAEPARLAAEAIRCAVALATGASRPGAAVKRLSGAKNLWSARVGIHHRLLFRFDSDQHQLLVLDLVDREDLDGAIKRHG